MLKQKQSRLNSDCQGKGAGKTSIVKKPAKRLGHLSLN